ncbi:short chain dehydrogenase [Colletotrichum salicis]|uniref:About the patent is no further information available n=1 Tax=Colletotrichum salicis TaxID=1209931 RepID=A0A135UXF3_9PEZI|nr:short chain dehydrogenase [Colletotrichum salicis]
MSRPPSLPPPGRYTELHKYENLAGPGDARPTALQIIKGQDLVGKLPPKVALVTGVSSGLGIETLKALAATGATVYGTARDLSKARAALDETENGDGGQEEPLATAPNVHLLEMDLTSLDSVRAAAAAFKKRSSRLDILVNNAGVITTRPHDLVSSIPGSAARVVKVTSSGHRLQGMNWSDVNFSRPGAYEGYRAYGQSKTANILMANGVDRRCGGRIRGYSVHPGTAMTGLQVGVREQMEALRGNEAAWRTVKSTAQGAATAVLAAVGREFEGLGPFYFEDCEVKGEGGGGEAVGGEVGGEFGDGWVVCRWKRGSN